MINKYPLSNWFKNDNRSVSVDICCEVYNHGKYLRQAIEGFLMQKTDFPVRIIIHDDASTDDSADIIREYKEKYPDKFVTILQEENKFQKGISIWNIMYPYFTAKYIAECEGDDYWLDENKLQKQVDYLENNPDCVAVYHNFITVDKNGVRNEALREKIFPVLKEGDYSPKEIQYSLLKTQTASLVRRNNNLWMSKKQRHFVSRLKTNEDQITLTLYGMAGRVHYLAETMSAYRKVYDEGDSWTAGYKRKSEYERYSFLENQFYEIRALYDYFTGLKTLPPYRKIIENRILLLWDARHNKKEIALAKKNEFKNHKIPAWAYLVNSPFVAAKCVKAIFVRGWRRIFKKR